MSFIETTEYEDYVVRYNVVHGVQSNLVLRLIEGTRTILRWSNGNEVLTYHTRRYPPNVPLGPFVQINHMTEGWRVDTQEELRQRIADDLFNHYDEGYGWNNHWARIAQLISGHIHGQGGVGANFNIEVETVVIQQGVADQNNPYWQAHFEEPEQLTIANNQRIPNACPICYMSVANVGGRIGLECGHVFCKECIYKWIWRHDGCPMCRGGIYG